MKKTVQGHASLRKPKSALWSDALSETYFPLDVECQSEAEFRGDLEAWSLGGVLELSQMTCDGILYHRHKHHAVNEKQSSLLITIPLTNEVNFAQSQRETNCRLGSFLIERGDAPYKFWHGKRTTLWALKVPTESVRSRLGPTERLAALSFDATTGVASYFIDAVRNAINHVENIDETVRAATGQHILDMLCLSIRQDDRILDSEISTVRAGHLYRAEQFIRDNLAMPELNSQMIADANGISLRYLQRLFAETDQSIHGFIREKRLNRCDEELKSIHARKTVAEIAYKWGFSDHAQFCKHYKVKFDCTPTEARKAFRKGLIMDD